jgi:putative ABC transport system permease protein
MIPTPLSTITTTPTTGRPWWMVRSPERPARSGTMSRRAVGAVGLVLGCLILIPALLVLVGRLGTRLVLPLRLAARDTARQRARSTPAVAAIMAAVAALTALSVGAASDNRQREREYQPQAAMGHGRIWLSPELDESVFRAVIKASAPDLVISLVSTVDQAPTPAEQGLRSGEPAPGSRLDVMVAKPPGCSDAAAFGGFGTGADGPIDPGCVRLGSGVQEEHAQIQVVSLATLAATATVSDAERRILGSGGMLVFDPKLMRGGFVELVTGRTKVGAPDKPIAMPVVTGHQRVPAAVIDRHTWQAALVGRQSGAWVLPATAAKLGWPVTPSHLDVISPTGMISGAAESAINDRLDGENSMQVERGFQNDSWLILLILFSVAGSLVLVASLISTALSMAESQNDMATLAAVGATRHTRRGIAASQALVVAVCGCVLGLLVGLVPGIAITWPLTTQGWDPATEQQFIQSPTIVIPWLHLMAICVGVPLLAAGLAWLAVRRHPQMTRRLV